MLHEFLHTHRGHLIRRRRFKVSQRSAPPASEAELQYGVPLVLEQLFEALVREKAAPTAHEDAVLYTVDEVVHEYADVCQAVTELAQETESPVTVDEFHTLNRLLDDSIAAAVSSYVRLHHSFSRHEGAQLLHERLGSLADEQRALLDIALKALEAIKAASAGMMASKGIVLEDSLLQLRDLIDRSLPESGPYPEW